MGLLDELNDLDAWRRYYAYKLEKGLAPREAEALRAFIEAEGFRPVTARLPEAGYCFAPPCRREISKQGSAKKRVVYAFAAAENYTLKLMAFLLYRYDGALPPNCYAFRREQGARQAIRRMSAAPDVGRMYGYKLDIQNYFNSIDVEKLLPALRETLGQDAPLYAFLSRLLRADEAIRDGALVREKRGAMAGTPISPFLANLYLADMDRRFYEQGVLYARYSDDILLFAPTEAEILAHRAYILQTLEERGLRVNADKEKLFRPGERWSFLGVEYRGGRIGLAPASREKLMGKIRRKARALYRWKLRKGATDAQAMRAFLRAINRKLYEEPDGNALTWARWFFPLLTEESDLHALDAYICDNIRYVSTGRYNKGNYRIRYEELKAYGFRSLVNAYYRYKKGEPVFYG